MGFDGLALKITDQILPFKICFSENICSSKRRTSKKNNGHIYTDRNIKQRETLKMEITMRFLSSSRDSLHMLSSYVRSWLPGGPSDLQENK